MIKAKTQHSLAMPGSMLSLYILIAAPLLVLTTHARSASDYYSYSKTSSSNASQSTILQPRIRWYRYYGSNGEPNLSSTITEQHLRYGYEALDRNMQVVKRVSPYSADQYAVQKAQRDAATAKRNADLELRRTYISSTQAAAKRDQILAEMTSRRSYISTQLAGLQQALDSDIAQAANFERQQKPIPKHLQSSLDENRKNVVEAQQNVLAIDQRQKQIRAEYEVIIRRLSAMEHGQP